MYAQYTLEVGSLLAQLEKPFNPIHATLVYVMPLSARKLIASDGVEDGFILISQTWAADVGQVYQP